MHPDGQPGPRQNTTRLRPGPQPHQSGREPFGRESLRDTYRGVGGIELAAREAETAYHTAAFTAVDRPAEDTQARPGRRRPDDRRRPRRAEHSERRSFWKRRWVVIPAGVLAAVLVVGLAMATTGIGGFGFGEVAQDRAADVDPKQSFTGGPATDPSAGPSASASPDPSASAAPPSAGPSAVPTRVTGGSTGGGSTGGGGGSGNPVTNPALRGCAGNPGSCGYPTTATTGVPAGTALTVIEGGLSIKTDGAVIEGKEIRGCVDVQAANVTLRNSKVVNCGVTTYGASGKVTIERVEINCGNGRGTGINGGNFAARAVFVHDCENGLEMNSNASIVDSVISAREGTSTAHGDGIQSQGGTNVVIRHNTLVQTNTVTSAIITNPTQNNSWTVEDNLMGGGGYTLYCPEQGQNFVVRNNRFVQAKLGIAGSAAYGLTDACNHTGIVWSGNYRDGDGAVVGP